MLTLTADRLAALEAQGFIVDEWERWQMGGCLEYAVALQRRHSHLRFGSFGRTDTSDPAYPSDDVQHHFAHDDTHAYDSAGPHLLPYLGIAGGADFCRLDEQASWYEVPHEPEVLAALAHINRHPILKAGTTMSDSELTQARARDVKVGDTIATRTHVFPLTITAREVRRGVIWLKYTNQTGKAEWHNTPPEEAVTILGTIMSDPSNFDAQFDTHTYEVRDYDLDGPGNRTGEIVATRKIDGATTIVRLYSNGADGGIVLHVNAEGADQHIVVQNETGSDLIE